jgi:tetratricopeptide (TPR) repeat protein
MVDLSHESLMRCWRRLIQWAQEERAAAALYTRLAREASWWAEGAAGLWGDPELELGLRWRRDNQPTAAWARRYDDGFDHAMQFLDLSAAERDRQRAERRAIRVRNLQIAWGSAAVLLVAFVIAVWQGLAARREYARAETNLRLATRAVDQLLLSVDRDPSSIDADVPQMEELRRELLERAKRFYAEFLTQQPSNEEFLQQMASGHFRLGHIHRMLEDPDNAGREYREAIAQFGSLVRDHPANTSYQEGLANSYNWLGETLRLAGANGAEEAYNNALGVQTKLVAASADNPTFQQELARTRYNRGILYANGTDAAATAAADMDFREAIRILDGVAQRTNSAQARQDLARAYNNLAALRALDASGLMEAKTYYAKAIALHQGLVREFGSNREYKSELAKFLNNDSDLRRELGESAAARESNAQALALIDDLVRPAPSLGIEQADAFNLRGRVLEAEGSSEAAREYRRAFELFKDLERGGADRLPGFHVRFGDLLANLVGFASREQKNSEAQRLIDEAVGYYAELGIRYSSDRSTTARDILGTLRQTTSSLPPASRARWERPIQALEEALKPPAPTAGN